MYAKVIKYDINICCLQSSLFVSNQDDKASIKSVKKKKKIK